MQTKDKTAGLKSAGQISAKERDTINAMPELYAQDGKGKDTIVHAHYFVGGYDFWCTECSREGDDITMFGLTHLFETELGITSFNEMKAIRVKGIFPVEFDEYWEPCRLADLTDENARDWVQMMWGTEEQVAEEVTQAATAAETATDTADVDVLEVMFV